MSWPAASVETRPVDALVPYARNSRTHSDAQVAQIAASIREWGWTTPVLVDEDGGIIAGHGRVLAARKLALTEVPCVIATGWTEAQKRAYVIADNQLALNAGWDEEMLGLELGELKDLDFDLELIGLSDGEIDRLFAKHDVDAGDLSGEPEEYEVIIECASEADQEAAYEYATKGGFKCRVSTS